MIKPGSGHGTVFPVHFPTGCSREGLGVAARVCVGVAVWKGIGVKTGIGVVVGRAAVVCEAGGGECWTDAYGGAAPAEHPSPEGVASG